MIELTIDGTVVSVPQGTTIFDAARLNGIAIPTLCHQQNENPVGVCRVCVVDVGAASLCRLVHSPGRNRNEGQHRHRSGRRASVARSLELLMADHPAPCARQQHSRRLRTRDVWLRQRRHFSSRASRGAATPRGHDDSSHRHRCRSRGLHSLRPLHPRLRRHPPQLRAGAARQGLSGRRRVRQQPADGRLDLRLLRRMHGVVPNRRADQ